jgi:hypothetical protein
MPWDANDILTLEGLSLSYLGKPEDGVEALRTARPRNPFALDWYLWCLGAALYTARRHEAAVAA